MPGAGDDRKSDGCPGERRCYGHGYSFQKASDPGGLCIAVHTEETVETEITTDLTEDKDAGEAPLYKRYEERELLSAFASKRDIFRIRKVAALEGTKENIETLLWTEVSLRKFDTRLEEDGIRLQGELKLFALYDAGEGKTDWVERTLPFEGRTECQGSGGNYVPSDFSGACRGKRGAADG